YVRALETGHFEQVVEKAAGGAHERLAFAVFIRAWRFADQHDARVLRPHAGHRLRARLVQVAARARLNFLVEFSQFGHFLCAAQSPFTASSRTPGRTSRLSCR